MNDSAGIVQISKHRRRQAGCPVAGKLPVVHIFFALGVIGGVVGAAWLGLHLWLMLNGLMGIYPDYSHLKRIHAIVQIYLFLGMFIAGFSFQAAPRLLFGPIEIPRYALPCAALTVVGCAVTYIWPANWWGPFLVSAGSSFVAWHIFSLARATLAVFRWGIGAPFVLGTLVLALGPWLDLADPLRVLLVLWFGVGAVIFATAQQFITGFFGGQKMGQRDGATFFVLMLISLGLGVLALRDGWWWTLYCSSLALTTVLFVIFTRAWRAARLVPSDPIALGFLLAFVWLLVGTVFLFRGPTVADFVVHIWATGWATTLIIATSSSIVGFLANRPVLRGPALIALLLTWQLVPLGRGLRDVLGLGPGFAWVTSTALTLVLLIWGAGLIWRGVGMVRAANRKLNAET